MIKVTPQRKKILVLLSILSFVLVVFLYLKISIKKNSQTIPFPAVSTPTPSIAPISKQKLIELMPIITQEYTIEYLSTSKKFAVMVLKGPFETTAKKVIDWFSSQGINYQDLDIYWWDNSTQ